MCKVEGCDRESRYKAQDVCQKHYFRFMRNGYYEKKKIRIYPKRGRKYRISNPAGYQKVAEPDHPLCGGDGYVYEHRFVYHNEINSNPELCETCGEFVNWSNLHIDHIDEDVSNNCKSNLRALCRSCNVFRGHSPTSMGKHIFTIDGKSMTASAWARMPDVHVSPQTILRRRREYGMNDYDAVFSGRKTHQNTKTKKIKAKYDKERGITP